MNSIVGADQNIGATLRKLVGRGEHQVAHALPVASIDAFHVRTERVRVHRDFRMVVRPEQLRAFDADSPITKRCAFGGASDDTELLRHPLSIQMRRLSGNSSRTHSMSSSARVSGNAVRNG